MQQQIISEWFTSRMWVGYGITGFVEAADGNNVNVTVLNASCGYLRHSALDLPSVAWDC